MACKFFFFFEEKFEILFLNQFQQFNLLFKKILMLKIFLNYSILKRASRSFAGHGMTGEADRSGLHRIEGVLVVFSTEMS